MQVRHVVVRVRDRRVGVLVDVPALHRGVVVVVVPVVVAVPVRVCHRLVGVHVAVALPAGRYVLELRHPRAGDPASEELTIFVAPTVEPRAASRQGLPRGRGATNPTVAKLVAGENCVRCNLYGIEARNATIRDADLSGADFSEARFSEGFFSQTRLTGTKFEGAHFNSIGFINVFASGASRISWALSRAWRDQKTAMVAGPIRFIRWFQSSSRTR